MSSECEIAAESPSSTACQTVPRIAMMNAAIIVLEWPGSSPCSAPSKMAVGTKSHAWVGALRERLGEVGESERHREKDSRVAPPGKGVPNLT